MRRCPEDEVNARLLRDLAASRGLKLSDSGEAEKTGTSNSIQRCEIHGSVQRSNAAASRIRRSSDPITRTARALENNSFNFRRSLHSGVRFGRAIWISSKPIASTSANMCTQSSNTV